MMNRAFSIALPKKSTKLSTEDVHKVEDLKINMLIIKNIAF